MWMLVRVYNMSMEERRLVRQRPRWFLRRPGWITLKEDASSACLLACLLLKIEID